MKYQKRGENESINNNLYNANVKLVNENKYLNIDIEKYKKLLADINNYLNSTIEKCNKEISNSNIDEETKHYLLIRRTCLNETLEKINEIKERNLKI